MPLFSFLLVLVLTSLPAHAQPPSMTMTAEPTGPVIQSQVTLTVRLVRERAFQQGSFVDPEMPGVLVEFAGESEPRALPDGREVIERRYLLFPQKTGRLEIPAPAYSGPEVHARAEPVTLDVRPRPAGAPEGWWLPAEALAVEETWSPSGRTVERRITVTARGLSGAQLPPIALPDPAKVRGWRVENSSETRIENGTAVGRRVERHLLMPLGEGTVELKGAEVTWWDVSAGVARTARGAGTTFEARGRAAASAAPPSERAPASLHAPQVWPWMIAFALGVAGLTWLSGRLSQTSGARERRLWRGVAEACRRDDAGAAGQALRAWSGGRGVLELARATGLEGLRELDRAAWGPGGTAWDGRRFLAEVGPALRRRWRGGEEVSPLPPLNPL